LQQTQQWESGSPSEFVPHSPPQPPYDTVENRNTKKNNFGKTFFGNFGQKSEWLTKIQILVRNGNLGQKSEFWSKIGILVKNRNFGKNIGLLVKYPNFSKL